jgi:hypothetical protein
VPTMYSSENMTLLTGTIDMNSNQTTTIIDLDLNAGVDQLVTPFKGRRFVSFTFSDNFLEDIYAVSLKGETPSAKFFEELVNLLDLNTKKEDIAKAQLGTLLGSPAYVSLDLPKLKVAVVTADF